MSKDECGELSETASHAIFSENDLETPMRLGVVLYCNYPIFWSILGYMVIVIRLRAVF